MKALVVAITRETEDGSPELLGTYNGTDEEGLVVRYFYGPDEEERSAPADCVELVTIPAIPDARPVDRSHRLPANPPVSAFSKRDLATLVGYWNENDGSVSWLVALEDELRRRGISPREPISGKPRALNPDGTPTGFVR